MPPEILLDSGRGKECNMVVLHHWLQNFLRAAAICLKAGVERRRQHIGRLARFCRVLGYRIIILTQMHC